ncbi:MAG TPA: M48 family metallopeptidase [Chitinophagaceae bacterium]|nr:M48 family metallopeptidase [Chitinophagaceae bacterium]
MHFSFRFPALSIFKKLVLLFAAILFTTFNVVLAQSEIFTPASENIEQLKSLLASFQQHYQAEIAALPLENKKDLLDKYKDRWENIKEKIDSKEIYTSEPAQKYLDDLVAEIVKANPLLQSKNFHCYFSRSGIPNASYIGEGIILFNMGLFSKLNNESQAAFVLCHELSHYYLRHNENSISRYVTMINSDEVQKQLRSIKKNEYGKRQELEKLLKGLSFDTRRHGRDHESQADSMAVEFMHNSRFDIGESLTTLSLLDSIDVDTLDMATALQKMFNAKEYPFQKKWIAKEEGLLGGHATLNKDEQLADSLKTHPDCKLRIQNLEPLVKKYYNASSSKNIVDQSKFAGLKNTFQYETVEYAFTSNNYTQSLQYTIELLQTHPSDPYLIVQIGKIFNGFYEAQKAHTLGKVVDLPAPYFEPGYNQLLQFIQNLYLVNFSSINYYFLKQYETSLAYYKVFKENYNKSLQINNNN